MEINWDKVWHNVAYAFVVTGTAVEKAAETGLTRLTAVAAEATPRLGGAGIGGIITALLVMEGDSPRRPEIQPKSPTTQPIPSTDTPWIEIIPNTIRLMDCILSERPGAVCTQLKKHARLWRQDVIAQQGQHHSISSPQDASDLPIMSLPEEAIQTLTLAQIPEDIAAFAKTMERAILDALHLTPNVRNQLLEALRSVNSQKSMEEAACRIWEAIEDEFVAHMREGGVEIKIIGHGENRRLLIKDLKSKNSDSWQILTILVSRMSEILSNPKELQYDSDTFLIPSLRMWLRLIRNAFPDAPIPMFVTGAITTDEIHQLHQAGKAPIALSLLHRILMADFRLMGHGYLFSLHDVYHWVRLASISPTLREFAIQPYTLIQTISNESGDSFLLKEMREPLADLDTDEFHVLVELLLMSPLLAGSFNRGEGFYIQKMPPADIRSAAALLEALKSYEWKGPDPHRQRSEAACIIYYLEKITETPPGGFIAPYGYDY